MTDKEFLNWIADRLIIVHKESPNVDFVLRLREVADRVEHVHSALTCEGCADITEDTWRAAEETYS